MSRFSFQGRRRRFSFGRRTARSNRALLAGLHLGCAGLLVFVPLQLPGWEGLALFALPFLVAAWLVLRERRAGLYGTYLIAGLLMLAALAGFIFTGRVLIGLVPALGVYFLVRQAVRFDAWLEDRDLEAEAAQLEALGAGENAPGEGVRRGAARPRRPDRRAR